jgi:hypothetical protein
MGHKDSALGAVITDHGERAFSGAGKKRAKDSRRACHAMSMDS